MVWVQCEAIIFKSRSYYGLVGSLILSEPEPKAQVIQRNLKKDLDVLYQVCDFQADWKTKMVAMASIG